MSQTIKKISVSNMVGASGNGIVNQFEINTDDGTYFQSYQTIIVCRKNGKTYLDENCWDCSVTTSKYRNRFLRKTTKEIKEKIKTGEYILTNLN